MEDGVPLEAEVGWAVKRLQNSRAGGAVKDAGGGPERVAGGELFFISVPCTNLLNITIIKSMLKNDQYRSLLPI